MTHITSSQNPRLKALKRLATRRERERSGRFAAEGEDLVLAAARAGRPPLEGFRLAGSRAGGQAFHDVDEAPLRAVSTLGSGTRVIGVYEQRWGEPAGPLCVYLHGVSDPGNVGTIVRSAHASRRVVGGARARLRRPALTQGGAREHGRDLRRRAGARARYRRAAGRARGAARRRQSSSCAARMTPQSRARSACSSAPSATACPRRWSPRAEAAPARIATRFGVR